MRLFPVSRVPCSRVPCSHHPGLGTRRAFRRALSAGPHATALWPNMLQPHISQNGFGGLRGCRGSPTGQSSWSKGCGHTPQTPRGGGSPQRGCPPRVGANMVPCKGHHLKGPGGEATVSSKSNFNIYKVLKRHWFFKRKIGPRGPGERHDG